MKKLSEILTEILQERTPPFEEFKPVVVKPMHKILETYGIIDILHTAKLWYEQNNEKSAVRLMDRFLEQAKDTFKDG